MKALNTQFHSQARRKVYKPLACKKNPPEVYKPLVFGQAWQLQNFSSRAGTLAIINIKENKL